MKTKKIYISEIVEKQVKLNTYLFRNNVFGRRIVVSKTLKEAITSIAMELDFGMLDYEIFLLCEVYINAELNGIFMINFNSQKFVKLRFDINNERIIVHGEQ